MDVSKACVPPRGFEDMCSSQYLGLGDEDAGSGATSAADGAWESKAYADADDAIRETVEVSSGRAREVVEISIAYQSEEISIAYQSDALHGNISEEQARSRGTDVGCRKSSLARQIYYG